MKNGSEGETAEESRSKGGPHLSCKRYHSPHYYNLMHNKKLRPHSKRTGPQADIQLKQLHYSLPLSCLIDTPPSYKALSKANYAQNNEITHMMTACTELIV